MIYKYSRDKLSQELQLVCDNNLIKVSFEKVSLMHDKAFIANALQQLRAIRAIFNLESCNNKCGCS